MSKEDSQPGRQIRFLILVRAPCRELSSWCPFHMQTPPLEKKISNIVLYSLFARSVMHRRPEDSVPRTLPDAYSCTMGSVGTQHGCGCVEEVSTCPGHQPCEKNDGVRLKWRTRQPGIDSCYIVPLTPPRGACLFAKIMMR